MKKVAVLTGTRAEYGLLRPVLEKIRAEKELCLSLWVTGTHLETSFGHTVDEIRAYGWQVDYELPMQLCSDQPQGILQSMAREMTELATAFKESQPDMLAVLGDRYELIPAVVAALINRVPVAHIHGGELTRGLIDDGIRHAVTKMSMLHFASTEVYRQRIIQMGEQPERVFNVGALGVENIRQTKYLGKAELSEKYGLRWEQPVVMVTYHPVTLEKQTAGIQFSHLLTVLSNHPEYDYIFTYANADTDGAVINEMIRAYVEAHGNCYAFASMGSRGYLSALHYTAAVVGNSSSGIIEVPSFGIPTVNIGNRQGGRVHAESVLDCGTTQAEMETTFSKALSQEFRTGCRKVSNPYEGKQTSAQIVAHIKEFLRTMQTTEKDFYDLPEQEVHPHV